ncbi:MAG: TonB-dependent receptor [Bacteroidales bacterium]|nr:TonB-dependent receptor [Bacteroidales bacterium]
MLKKKLQIAKGIVMMLCALFVSLGAYAQNRNISGKIVDTSGQPVIGAAVTVVGNTSIGAATDLDGNFTLSVPAGSSISIESIGFKSQTFVVGNQSVFNVTLEDDTEMLEETVVIGYGVQRKSDVTGAIASVKESDLENRTATDVAQALQGKAAGVQIVNASGAPGSASSIQIRGYSSNSRTSPLMIVDGLKVNDISYLDPESIASIEILKDAASAAIYGVEAGNGVVLVTTKSGQKGSGRVFYNFQHTIQNIAHLPDMMNARDYMDYLVLSGAATQDQIQYDGKTDTKWTDYMLETGHQQRHTLGFEGGNDRAKFYASLAYTDNNGIIKGDKDIFKRLVGQINAEYKIKDWLTVGVNTTIDRSVRRAVSESSTTSESVMGAMFVGDPTTPWTYDDNAIPAHAKLLMNDTLPRDPDGHLYGISVFNETSYIWHPQAILDRQDTETQSFRVRGTAFLNLTPIKGLVITSRFGFQGGYSHTNTYNHEVYISAKTNQSMSISGSTNDRLYYQWENFANYTKAFGKHELTAMAGMSYQQTNTDNLRATAYQLTMDVPNFRYLDNAVNTANMSVGGQPEVRANMSYFGRIGYSYDNRYFFQANFRADAYDSSKLDKNHRWGYFPSVSAGWTISNEPFMQSVKSALSLNFLKLRASWGVNGNVNALGEYQYASSLESNKNYGYNLDGSQFLVGIRPSKVLPNPSIKWETSRQVDLGLDLRMFKNRLTFSVDWYNKNTHDLLTRTTAPGNTGAEYVYVNAGLVNNHGTEFELGWKDTIGDFSYGIDANLSTVHNKVVKGTSADRVPGQKIWSSYDVTYFEEGYPLWYLRTFMVDHVDQATGAAVYKDFDNDGEITADDRDFAGSGIPDFTYGLTINLAYKGFDFLVLGAGSQGAELLYAVTRADALQQNTLRTFYADAWKNASSTGYKYPKPDVNDKFYRTSNMRVYDASFFKIKQIQLGYTLPRNLTKKIAISSLRAYVSLDDWFTFTKYPGLDPETSHAGSSASGLGVDYGSYPISKKLVFGVNVSF